MSDVDAPQDTAPPSSGLSGSPLRILGQFIKDLSFEVPHAPEIYSLIRDQGPEIPVSIDTNVRHMDGSTFEVTLSLHIEATLAGKKAFILEVAYGCVVEINTQIVPKEHVHPALLIEVPRQIFPFVRQIVTDATTNGGFPPLMLQMFDFAEMYGKKFGSGNQSVEGSSSDNAVH